jgi:alpha-tubulin suppressor-like RCC1 family protein
LAFRQVSAGENHTCGVTADDLAYCWGDNSLSQLGNGTYGDQFCMDIPDCIAQPVAVAGGLRFRQLSAGAYHTCGVTTDYRAYCWGASESGLLGIGPTTGPETCIGNESVSPCSIRPVAVLGGRAFKQVSAGIGHTCAVTTTNQAFCWGWNGYGQLGDRTTTTRLTPVAVAGGIRFRQVDAGVYHTCGVTTANVAFCWGGNASGQIGDSTQVARRLRPARVAGGRAFKQVSAGGGHTCAVTTTNQAYCWGDGLEGQLGTGNVNPRFWPRRVVGTVSFDRVTAGKQHTCGEATDNRAYCWGDNYYGALGDGTPTTRLTPVAVAGGLFFSQLSAGEGHTCGRTPAAVAYCWGSGKYGEVGDGTWGSNHPTPVPVAPPAP